MALSPDIESAIRQAAKSYSGDQEAFADRLRTYYEGRADHGGGGLSLWPGPCA